MITMKKLCLIFLSLCLLLPSITLPIYGEEKKQQESSGELAASAKGVYLCENTTGKVIYARNEKEKLYPASMTKMMGLLLIFESLHDGKLQWDDSVTTSEYAASMGGSQVFLEVGETMSVEDMVKSICIASANDAMVAMGEKIGGTTEGFVEMMNEKAKELGMEHTHFTNSTGLQDEDHYSTVRDISVLLRYALAGDTFRQVFTSSSYSTNPSACHPEGFTFASTMFQEMNSAAVTDGEILGGKTGYTKEAGLCLASLALIGQKEYILITAHARGDHETRQYHVEDAVKVYTQLGKQLPG